MGGHNLVLKQRVWERFLYGANLGDEKCGMQSAGREMVITLRNIKRYYMRFNE